MAEYNCKWASVCNASRQQCGSDCLLIPLYDMRAKQAGSYDKEIIVKNIPDPVKSWEKIADQAEGEIDGTYDDSLSQFI